MGGSRSYAAATEAAGVLKDLLDRGELLIPPRAHPDVLGRASPQPPHARRQVVPPPRISTDTGPLSRAAFTWPSSRASEAVQLRASRTVTAWPRRPAGPA